jgi:TRAP-type transport system periplasmic protein
MDNFNMKTFSHKLVRFFYINVLILTFTLPLTVFGGQVLIKLGHVDPEDVYTSKKGAAARVFKDIIEAETSGAIKVYLFPAGQLGGERELIESAIMGMVQMIMVSGAIAGYFEPAMVLDIPYLFSSAPVAWKVLDGPFGKELANAIQDKTGLKVLAYGETGFRNFTNSKKRVTSPASLKGLKIRVMETPLYIKMVKALGASPTPISWPEVYSALQQKVVDGQENPVGTILQAKFSEVQKYLTLDGHTYSADFLVINNKFYKNLSDEHQNIIKRAAIIAGNVGRSIQQLSSAMGVSKLRQAGMDVYSPTSSERMQFKNATQQPVIRWMNSKIDSSWIDKVMKAVKNAEAELSKQ